MVTEKIDIPDVSYDVNDRTAVKECLIGMKKYIETGVEFYPMHDALNDAYTSILMGEALTKKTAIQSEKQPWDK